MKTDAYEARTLEDIMRDGYPDLRREELKHNDRLKRDEFRLRRVGLYDGCVIT